MLRVSCLWTAQAGGREDLAIQAHGYLLLSPQQEPEVDRKTKGTKHPLASDKKELDGDNSWGRYEEHRHLPVRAIVKELVSHQDPFTRDQIPQIWRDLEDLHGLGILVRDINVFNYMGGKLIDFGRAWTTPHPFPSAIHPWYVQKALQGDPLDLNTAFIEWGTERDWNWDIVPGSLLECASGNGRNGRYGINPDQYNWHKWEKDPAAVEAFMTQQIFVSAEDVDREKNRIFGVGAYLVVASTSGALSLGGANGIPKARPQRPCDNCRKRKSRCEILEDDTQCVLCQFHNKACTFISDAPKKKRRVSESRIEVNTAKLTPTVIPQSGNPAVEIRRAEPVKDYADLKGPSLLKKTLGLQNHRHSSLIGPTSVYEPRLLGLPAFRPGDDIPVGPRSLRKVSATETFVLEPDTGTRNHDQDIDDLDAIESLVAPHGPQLIALYFRIVHPTFPILHKKVFLEKYERTHREFTPPLLAAVYILTLNWWCYSAELSFLPKPDERRLEEIALKTMGDVVHRPKLSTIQAADWDVRPVDASDFPESAADEDDEEGSTEVDKGRVLFCEMIKLAQILADVLRDFYSVAAEAESRTNAGAGVAWVLRRAKPLQLRLKSWFADLPECLRLQDVGVRKLSSTGYLHLAYYAAEITLHRRIVAALGRGEGPDSPELERVCRLAAQERLVNALDFVNTLRPEHLQSFWYSASTYNFALIGTFISLLWVTSAGLDDAAFYKQKLDEYRWALRLASKGSEALERAVTLFSASTGMLVKAVPATIEETAHGTVEEEREVMYGTNEDAAMMVSPDFGQGVDERAVIQPLDQEDMPWLNDVVSALDPNARDDAFSNFGTDGQAWGIG
ncbi:hypothetical protein NEMBOFW57_001092 [Staphylotrichum longicolle]|uniref:Zn(2)-C6 fungal-type domain-containing protein n=1 Tax=Staphylotrichum longicolle TaxID=669026 RepID=A0AAD4F3V6_9PEZI|nr:hypothetical protein NEMBOFW57_001092 [Staphylotrichum longicolle]